MSDSNSDAGSGVIVNDFTLRIATPNGTGSQTSNNLIFRTLFTMGLAASVKNLFPSNIQGLPTWFQIRVSPHGFQARTENWEVLIALNPATVDQDLAELPPGSVVIDNADQARSEAAYAPFVRYSIPFDTLARKHLTDAKLRPRLRNMIYVGAVAELFGLDDDCLKAALTHSFARKQAVVDANWEALQIGVNYVREQLPKRDPYRYAKADQTAGKIAIEGNDAAALGILYGGCSVAAWYPITPASSLAESLQAHVQRANAAGMQRPCAILQAEDELAAVGMALGAGWAGARAMTSTSGPGISLMGENLGFGYYAEIPCVVFDVQRVGPSTGLPTRTQQSDLLQVAFLSHGDTRFPMLLPATTREAFDFSAQAFDLAERFQIPLFVMSDLDLGMNLWVDDPPEYPAQPFDRGKLVTTDKLAELKRWGRYLDVDGDGIPWRSLPSRETDPRLAYFTRGSGHSEMATYSEDGAIYQRNLDRLARKVDGLRTALPAPVTSGPQDARLGLIAFGSTHPAVHEALFSGDLPVEYLRVRAYPFHPDIGAFLDRHEQVVVVEQNQQGQLAQLLRMEFPQQAARIVSACHYGGLPVAAAFVRRVLDGVLEKASHSP